jgi:hypothetical protein
MRVDNRVKSVSLFVFVALFAASCQTQVTSNTNSTANVASGNNTVNSNIGNTNSVAVNNATIDTREPDQYQAKVTVRAETSTDPAAQQGQQQPAVPQNLPALSAMVARNGDARRMEFALPNGEKVVYLDKGGQSLLILPNRKQIAELNKESTGFEVRALMTPEQIVRRVQTLKGLEKVGEENFNGRDAVKYRYAAVSNTKSEAGQVNSESVLIVDKETSLPLRSETVSEATGQVRGVKGLRVVTEMSEIQTTAPADLFVEPADFQRVPPEQVRAQVNTIFQVAMAFLGQFLQNNTGQTTAAPSASPAASPAISPAASPAQ